MSDRIASIVVLAEDQEHQNLVRRFLQRAWGKDFSPRKVVLAPLPNGRGAGEQFVRMSFPREVRALRSRRGKRTSCLLIVVVDADTVSVADRRRQLDDELANSGVPVLSADEPIVVLIPKRHVETWIRALLGHAVDERGDYKVPEPTKDEIRRAATALLEGITSEDLPASWPPSLQTSAPGWRRIRTMER